MSKIITIQTTINSPIEKVWKLYTTDKDVMKWNHASDDWHTPKAKNDLRVGGRFVYRMESKDEEFGFDFSGKYTKVENHKIIAYEMDDKRKVEIIFESKNSKETKITIKFEAENENSIEMQKNGWQAILDNFKKYTENN